MAKTVFDVLKDKIAVELQAANEHLTSGALKDFAEYRLREIEGLSRNYMENEDD